MFSPTITLLALIVLAMLCAGGLAYGLLYARVSTGGQAAARRRDVMEAGAVPGVVRAKSSDPGKRRRNVQESLREMEQKERARARSRSSPALSLRLQQAGLTWTRRGYFIFSVVVAVIVVGLCFLLGLPYYAALGFGAAGAFGLPMWIVNYRRKRRMKKFLKEFPNAVDIIVRGVKAGLPLNDCLRIIANEAAEPVKSEFRQIHEAQQIGLTVTDAVGRMPERVPVSEANFFAIVISIQQRAGGNLAEALGNLSKVLRERAKMGGKIKAMSMEAKASGYIIGALPFVVMALVYITSPEYIMLLFTDQVGNVILGAAGLWMSIGIFVMRKMINFDF